MKNDELVKVIKTTKIGVSININTTSHKIHYVNLSKLGLELFPNYHVNSLQI